MKRILFNHLKRWSLVWIGAGIFQFITTFSSLTLRDQGKSIDPIHSLNFALLLWLSAFALNFDLQRGSGRAQMTLPVSAGQIGRAWWIVAVALPTLFLALITSLAMLIHSAVAAKGFPLDDLAMTAITCALYFGSLFYLLIGSPPGPPQNALAWVRMTFMMGFFLGIIFIKPAFDTPQGILFLGTAAILTVIGWFRAGHMAGERATFRPGIQFGKRKPGQHQAPAGFGGLPLLWRNLAVQLGYTGLAVIAWLAVSGLLIPGLKKSSPKQLLEVLSPSATSFGLFFIYFTILIPVILQLRHLRTLPISAAKLAATLVAMVVVPVFSFGLAWSALGGTGLELSPGVLMYAAVSASGVPVILWRGLKWATYFVFLFFMMAVTLVPIIFHPKIPPVAATLGSLGVILLALAFTRRLLQSSRHAYRPLPAMINAWGACR